MPRYRGELLERFPAPPAEPYLYNDPRISYNEPCFAYNGGFDIICLFGDRKRGPIVGGKSRKIYPNPNMMEIFFQTCYKNEDDIESCEVKKYTVNKTLDTKISSEIVSISNKKTKIEVSATGYVKQVTKGMQSNIDFINGLTPSVSSSLKLQIPRKIIFKSERTK